MTGPGPRSFRKSDNSNCQKTVRTSCPTLRVMYELSINIPVSYTSLGLHVLHAGYTSEVGYGWQGGRTGAANVDWRFFLSSRPSKIAFTRSPQATRERSQAAQRGPMPSLRNEPDSSHDDTESTSHSMILMDGWACGKKVAGARGEWAGGKDQSGA